MPSDLSVNSASGFCGNNVSFVAPVGSDNCPSSSTLRTAGLPAGYFSVGITNQSFVVTDHVGLSATCSFSVTVIDTEAPTIVCSPDIVVPNVFGFCSSPVSYVWPSTNDNCGVQNTNISAGFISNSTFPVGITRQTYRAADARGNFAVCSFNVEVQDIDVPTISCPSSYSVASIPGTCAAFINYTVPVGVDNCPGTRTRRNTGRGTNISYPVGSSLRRT